MIIPAIDLIEGAVVRLKKGDFNEKTVFKLSPLSRIEEAARDGAQLMHIVDLDGARDPKLRQLSLIESLVRSSPIPIQTGGGIRSADEVAALLDRGVARVVVGSVAVKDPSLVKTWFKRFGPEHLTLALDVKLVDGVPRVATHGWQELSSRSVYELLDLYKEVGLEHVLVTDIDRDGMLKGPNVGLYRTLHAYAPALDFIASGGMSSLEDVTAIARSGARSVVLGRALLEGRFTVKEAITCWQNA